MEILVRQACLYYSLTSFLWKEGNREAVEVGYRFCDQWSVVSSQDAFGAGDSEHSHSLPSPPLLPSTVILSVAEGSILQ